MTQENTKNKKGGLNIYVINININKNSVQYINNSINHGKKDGCLKIVLSYIKLLVTYLLN